MNLDADVIVAGGGPAGLAAAIGAAEAGRSVIVVEPRAGVIDKACGEGLMPGALRALGELGVGGDMEVRAEAGSLNATVPDIAEGIRREVGVRQQGDTPHDQGGEQDDGQIPTLWLPAQNEDGCAKIDHGGRYHADDESRHVPRMNPGGGNGSNADAGCCRSW